MGGSHLILVIMDDVGGGRHVNFFTLYVKKCAPNPLIDLKRTA